MKRWLAPLLVVTGLSRVQASPPVPPQPQRALDQGRTAYQHNDYPTAVDTIRPLLYPRIELGDERSVIEAHKLLALSYFYMKKSSQAEEEFTSLLALSPNFDLDANDETTTAVSFFQGIRHRQEDRLREIRERQREENQRRQRDDDRKREEARRRAERVYVERTVVKNSRLIACLPFGIGQLANGQPRKAIAFGVAESLLGALSIGSWIALRERFPGDRYKVDPRNNIDERPLATALQALPIATGALFFGVVAWGILDAQLKFVPERVLRLQDLAAPPAKPKVTLTPIWSPSFVGLTGAF